MKLDLEAIERIEENKGDPILYGVINDASGKRSLMREFVSYYGSNSSEYVTNDNGKAPADLVGLVENLSGKEFDLDRLIPNKITKESRASDWYARKAFVRMFWGMGSAATGIIYGSTAYSHEASAYSLIVPALLTVNGLRDIVSLFRLTSKNLFTAITEFNSFRDAVERQDGLIKEYRDMKAYSELDRCSRGED